MIRVIFFDLYGTLARFHPPREHTQARACRQLGLRVSGKGLEDGYALADSFMAQQNATHPIRLMAVGERADFFARYEQLVLSGAGCEVSLAIADKAWRIIRETPSRLTLYDDVVPVLRSLGDSGYMRGLISNLDREGQSLLEELGLERLLDYVVTAKEVGAEKPHPSIFRAALHKANALPIEAVHVGDQVISDVRGARSVGILPVLIDRKGMESRSDCAQIRSLGELELILA